MWGWDFQPVRVEPREDIRLHSERYTLPAATADALRRALQEGGGDCRWGRRRHGRWSTLAREAGAFSGVTPQA